MPTEPNESMYTFPNTTTPILCSAIQCKNDHSWLPKLAIGVCPGCRSPVIAVKMENCPFCNEPPIRLSARVDHISTSMQIVPACTGAPSFGEIGVIDIELEASAKAESGIGGSRVIVPTQQ